MSAGLDVQVWVDVAGEQCYLAKRRLEEAVHGFEHPAEVSVRYRSYTLASPDLLDAHRLVQLALASGGPAEQSAVLERLFSACLREGRDIGDRPTLQRLAAEAGLDERRVASVLAADDYTAEVRQDEALAARLGVDEVPHILVNGRYPLTGAQPVETVLGLLREAWTARG